MYYEYLAFNKLKALKALPTQHEYLKDFRIALHKHLVNKVYFQGEQTWRLNCLSFTAENISTYKIQILYFKRQILNTVLQSYSIKYQLKYFCIYIQKTKLYKMSLITVNQ